MAHLHWILLLCKQLPNDRPLSSSCLGWVWANALQYDTHYTPWRVSRAPRRFLVLSFLFFYHPSFSPSFTLLSSVAFTLSTFIQTFLGGSLCHTAFYLLSYETYIVCCKVQTWLSSSGCCVTEELGSIKNDLYKPKRWVKIDIFETFMCFKKIQ